MKIIRYQNSPLFSPANNFTALRDEMDRLFDVACPALSTLQRDGFPGPDRGEFPIDLYRDKNNFVVRAELPGFRKEDMSVEVVEGILTVTAHQRTGSPETQNPEKQEKPETRATVQERRFSRAISLPNRVKADAIQAHYENGVLTVTLPQQEEAKPRQIAIEVK
jgi:HSP20 family protein